MVSMILSGIGAFMIGSLSQNISDDDFVDSKPYTVGNIDGYVISYTQTTQDIEQYMGLHPNYVFQEPVSSEVENAKNIIAVMKNKGLNLGVAVEMFNNLGFSGDIITRTMTDMVARFLLSITSYFNPRNVIDFQFYAMPLVQEEKVSTLQPYIAMMGLGVTFLFMNSVTLYQALVVNRVEQKKDILVFSGMNKYKYHLCFNLATFLIFEVQMVAVFIVMIACNVQLATGSSVLVYFVTATATSAQMCMLTDILSNIGTTVAQFQQWCQLIVMMILTVPSMFYFFIMDINCWAVAALSFIPSLPLMQMAHSLFLNAHVKYSLAQVYFANDNLFALTVFQLLYLCIYFIVALAIDRPYRRSKKRILSQTKAERQNKYSNIYNFNVENVEHETQFLYQIHNHQYPVHCNPKGQQDLETVKLYVPPCLYATNEAHKYVIVYNVSKVYSVKNQKILANDGISIFAKQGEVLGILGPNGSGKTTLCKAIMMAQSIDSGDIVVRGSSIHDNFNEVKNKIGICMQGDNGLFDDMTVGDHLRLYYNIARKKTTIDIVNVFELQQHLQKKVRELSGGWKRRLTVACAFINDPDVLILDEITSGVDVVAREKLWELVRHLCGSKIVIATTHTLHEAQTYFDRTAFIFNGRIVCVGSVSEILEQVKDRICVNVYGILPEDFFSTMREHGIIVGDTQDAEMRIQTLEASCPADKTYILFEQLSKLQNDNQITSFSVTHHQFDQVFCELYRLSQQ